MIMSGAFCNKLSQYETKYKTKYKTKTTADLQD